MKNACLVCGEDLRFFEETREMECVFCHTKHMSNASCENGHYVCDECHGKQAVVQIRKTALETESKDPFEIAVTMMRDPYVHMHGNENHTLVGSALLAAYHNAGGQIDLNTALEEMHSRGKQVPGGVCGFWGACGAAISAGIFVSIITGSTPISRKEWGQSNLMTAKALGDIGAVGGPRCCKRNAFLSIGAAVEFCRQEFGIRMETSDVFCEFSPQNKQCIGIRCPFHAGRRKQSEETAGRNSRKKQPEETAG